MPDDDADTSAPDLSPVTTPELIAELTARCDAIILAYLPKANPDGKAHYEQHGSWVACVGMATTLKHDMLHDYEGDDDDD